MVWPQSVIVISAVGVSNQAHVDVSQVPILGKKNLSHIYHIES